MLPMTECMHTEPRQRAMHCVWSDCAGVGHYDCVSELTLLDGDIKNEKIVCLSSKADTVLAVSGQSSNTTVDCSSCLEHE